MRYSTIVLIVFCVLFFGGCNSKQALQKGDAAPEFSVSDLSGRPISLSRNKGKITILYFWTNSCCGDSLKLVEPLYRAYDKKLEVLAVNCGDSKEVAGAYARSNGLTFPMVADEQAALLERYRVRGFPTIYVIDAHGVIRDKILGHLSVVQLEKIILRQIDMQKKAGESYETIHSR
ncbi:TlpA disulfide reductase family protein [Geobacter sp. SVR]|uniref:TlpA family protein disulfide reductase n=1 Tax=Geobacter sp. SVR TaxID=2495594 RepID=UPI00143EFD37|nr:TlpA disulfide reductase family protein [Geobacter sp. SVR]BCS56070.1 hypothetical protein GSVR_43780 [Geobacter sp. SVR]GCF84833.1 thiol:disulfide interchange protein tlpA [Geobacter sp. SVR]